MKGILVIFVRFSDICENSAEKSAFSHKAVIFSTGFMVMFRYCQISQPGSESALDEAAAAVYPVTVPASMAFPFFSHLLLL